MGIKLAPDQRTTTIMKTALNNLEGHKELYKLFQQLHGEIKKEKTIINANSVSLSFNNKNLNASQQQAVVAITQNEKNYHFTRAAGNRQNHYPC
ncbi:MAG: hypothetical protein WDM90_19180 [Ferruginibacter sp.]